MKRMHLWLVAACVAMPILLAAEAALPAFPKVDNPFPEPAYKDGSAGYPGPRCKNLPAAPASKAPYPAQVKPNLGTVHCTHYVWLALRDTGDDWSKTDYAKSQADWNTLTGAEQNAQLKKISKYFHEHVDLPYKRLFETGSAAIKAGADASQLKDAAPLKAKLLELKLWSDKGEPGAALADFQEKLKGLVTALGPKELTLAWQNNGSITSETGDVKKIADALAKRDKVLGEQLPALFDQVDAVRKWAQAVGGGGAATDNHPAQAAEAKLGTNIDEVQKRIKADGAGALSQALFDGDNAPAKALTDPQKASIKASMKDLLVVKGIDGNPVVVQRIQVPGPNDKPADYYKFVSVGADDTLSAVAAKLADQLAQGDDKGALWKAMQTVKAAAGEVASNPAQTAKDTLQKVAESGWFPPAAGMTKRALEDKYRQEKSDAGLNAQKELRQHNEEIIAWYNRAFQECEVKWTKYGADKSRYERTLDHQDLIDALAALTKESLTYSAAGPKGGPATVSCALGSDPQIRYPELAAALRNAQDGYDQTKTTADAQADVAEKQNMQKLGDSEFAKRQLRRQYLREELTSDALHKELVRLAKGDAAAEAIVKSYLRRSWPKGVGNDPRTFYLDGWKPLGPFTKETFQTFVDAEKADLKDTTHPREDIVLKFFDKDMPLWPETCWLFFTCKPPADSEVKGKVKEIVLDEFARFLGPDLPSGNPPRRGQSPPPAPLPPAGWKPPTPPSNEVTGGKVSGARVKPSRPDTSTGHQG